MRKIYTKIMSFAMTAVMAASVVTITPANVSAAAGEKAKLGKWQLYQSGECKWDAGDYSQLDSLVFADGESYAKDDLRTCKCEDSGKKDAEGKTIYNLIDAMNRFENKSNGFTAKILSNGWQADYSKLDSYSKNNPWALRMEMNGIQANFGQKYKLNFKAVVTESDEFEEKYANIVVTDIDTNVLLAKTIVITKEEQDFSFDFAVIYKDELNMQIFLGAFPVKAEGHQFVDPIVTKAEANWKGTVNFSNIEFVDTGVRSEKIKTVKFVDGGKTVKTVYVNTEDNATVSPVKVKKAGYKFVGWYNGSSKFNFNNSVSKDMTLTAKWSKVKKPGKVKISSAESNKAKQITVKVKKVSKVDGYQYQLLNSKGKKVKTVETSKTKYTFKKLKSGQKYYVQVKAYVKDSKGKIYASKKWSKKKACYAN